MKHFSIVLLTMVFAVGAFAQDNASTIFQTEKAFERAVAEKGMNPAFIEYLAPTGVMLNPFPINGREMFAKRKASGAALNWDPTDILVSSNGLLAFSIGRSVYRPSGKDDPNAYYGHYITVWARQPDGKYLAALDGGINHEKPSAEEPAWAAGAGGATEENKQAYSAADSSTPFWETIANIGAVGAYKDFLADDAILLRDGIVPIRGKKDALKYFKRTKPRVKFPKRKAFIESADLAYVADRYSILDEKGAEVETGGFVQVWKFRKGRWLIAAEAWIPAPKK